MCSRMRKKFFMTCMYYATQVLTLSKTSHVILRFQGPQMRPQIKRKLAVTIKGQDGKCNEAIKKTSLPKLLHHMAFFYKGRRLNNSQNSSTTLTVQADDFVAITFSVIQSPKEPKETQRKPKETRRTLRTLEDPCGPQMNPKE